MQALDPDYADKYAENYAAASEALKTLGEDMRYACLGLEGKKAAVGSAKSYEMLDMNL